MEFFFKKFTRRKYFEASTGNLALAAAPPMSLLHGAQDSCCYSSQASQASEISNRGGRLIVCLPDHRHQVVPPQLSQERGSQYLRVHTYKAKKLIVLNRPPTPFAVKPIGAFYVFLVANILAAIYAPIQDCDETFNYWEPTHYLSHGYGLQTWEYSPVYAIRSWLYIAIHALVGSFRRLLPFSTKVSKFAGLLPISTDPLSGWGVLLHSICPRLRLCHLPNTTFSSHKQYIKSPNRYLLFNGKCLQSRHVSCICRFPTLELRDVHDHVGYGRFYELAGRTEDGTRHFLLCCWRHTRMAFCDGSVSTVSV